MQPGFVWCPHCGQPHRLKDVVCPTTGKSIERSLHASNEKPHPLLGATLDGRYRLVRVIGSGGVGVVFEAENLALRRAVAVKIVSDPSRVDQRVRLEREARIVASLQHPNICDVYDVGFIPELGPYLVTERLFGETLATYRQRHRRIPYRIVLDFLLQILSGLQAAHAQQIVHRDLKPRNVFLVDRLGCPPLVKVLDFGLAKDLSRVDARTITRPGHAVGTPHYMAPEQITGEGVTVQSDLFATGVTAYELIAAAHPYGAATLADMQARLLRDEPTPLRAIRPEVPEELARVVQQAVARSPARRFPDAIAMQAALVATQARLDEADADMPESGESGASYP